MAEALEGLRPGSSLAVGGGKYRLIASLGRGGMADVFLGVSHGAMGFNKLVVVKRLRPTLCLDRANVDMFLDEARLAARLNHPNVVHTYEVGSHEDTYFIAMEYLEGQPLHRIRRAAKEAGIEVRPVVWARIIADALTGLQYAHELKDYDGKALNVIHRDISPHNIFVTYDGTVKVVDFGIAKAAINANQTAAGIVKGKIAYMAPEQALGDEVDRRADIFAMGIVLWELLTNKRLFGGDSPSAAHTAISMKIKPPSGAAPGTPPELDAIVMRALQRYPEDRYQSAQEMRRALEQYVRSAPEPVGDKEVSDLLTTMFTSTREALQQQIEKHMVGDPLSTGELPGLSSSGSNPSLEISGVRSGTRKPLPVTAPVETKSRGTRNVVLAAVGLSIAALVASAILIARRPGSAPAASQEPAPRPTVELRIRATPAEAEIFVDDKKLPNNPFSGPFPKDGLAHHVRVTAPGYTAAARLVLFDADVTIAFDLERPPASSAPAASSAPTTTTTAVAPARPHATPPPSAKPRTRVTLDQDPWK